jgi:cation diffusion facilitator family transporter
VITLVANAGVAIGKITVGLMSRSLAMTADGIHSSVDATSNIVGLISNALSARPPDEEHPYGHRRFETVASLVIGGGLLLTAWEIMKSSINNLINREAPQITRLNFIVMLVTIGVNLMVTFYERRAGKRLRSEFLLADAAHTQSDVFVSLAVLVSLVATRAGLRWVDPLAALVVVGLILRVAWRVFSGAFNILVDRAALDSEAVREIVEAVPGVQSVRRVRSRGPEDDVYLDLEIEVAGPTTTDRADAILSEIRRRVRAQFDGVSDVQVVFRPLRQATPDHALQARAVADALGLSIHEVITAQVEEGFKLKMHVEVEPTLSVEEAHNLVSTFEDRLKERITDLNDVITHIEPAHRLDEAPYYDESASKLGRQALVIAQEVYPQGEWHDLAIYAETDGGYAISIHCYVEGSMPLQSAHRMAEEVETDIRARLPLLHRVTIHTEPFDADK